MNIPYWVLNESSLIYLLNATFSAIGVLFFAWWWIKSGRVSFIYAYITLWFVGNFITAVVNEYAVCIGYNIPMPEVSLRYILLRTWWWPKRYYIETLAGLLLVGTVIKRALFGNKKGMDIIPCLNCIYRDRCVRFQDFLKGPNIFK